MPIRISSELEWLLPFVESAHGIVNVKKLSRLTAYRVPFRKEPKVAGVCTRWSVDGRVTDWSISLLTHDRIKIPSSRRKPKYRYEPIDAGTILESLAHELAHLSGLEHDPGHTDRTARILDRFVGVMEKLGIDDLDGVIS